MRLGPRTRSARPRRRFEPLQIGVPNTPRIVTTAGIRSTAPEWPGVFQFRPTRMRLKRKSSPQSRNGSEDEAIETEEQKAQRVEQSSVRHLGASHFLNPDEEAHPKKPAIRAVR
jgi:hypothetical protein